MHMRCFSSYEGIGNFSDPECSELKLGIPILSIQLTSPSCCTDYHLLIHVQNPVSIRKHTAKRGDANKVWQVEIPYGRVEEKVKPRDKGYWGAR